MSEPTTATRGVRVQLRLFALYRELTGVESLSIDLPAGTTVGGLVAGLRERGGGFARLPAAPLAAVNQEFAPIGTVLRDGDEVALLPPVAGG